MDLEITAKNTAGLKIHILLRDVPDEASLGELKKHFSAYIAQGGVLGQWDIIGIAKVTFESGNEQKYLDD